MALQQFGGNWTDQKLAVVKKYLNAYLQALKKQSFSLVYIDAFAGTGYRETAPSNENADLLNPLNEDALKFIDGSAIEALKLEPGFQRYVLIELNRRRFLELEQLKTRFPAKASRIELVNDDANDAIISLCKSTNWRNTRAVMFLDPFGMSVRWGTLEEIARTEAIDLWLLFPLGVAVNRLLKRDANIPDAWRSKLTEMFGTDKWFEEFYKEDKSPFLFEMDAQLNKVGTPENIGNYFVKRLEMIFNGVAKNPLPLRNSTGSWLFLLCFASGNPKGSKIAINIAEHILKAGE